MKISKILAVIAVALLSSGIIVPEEARQPEMVKLYVDSVPSGAEAYLITYMDDLNGDLFETIDPKLVQRTPTVFDVKPGKYNLCVRTMVSAFKPSTEAFNLVQGYVCSVEAHQKGELGIYGPPSSPFIKGENRAEIFSYLDQTKKVTYIGQLAYADCTEGDSRVVVSWWPKGPQGTLTFNEMKPLLGNDPNCFAVDPSVIGIIAGDCGYSGNAMESIIFSLGHCGMAAVSEERINPDSGRLQFFDRLFFIGPPSDLIVKVDSHIWEEEDEPWP